MDVVVLLNPDGGASTSSSSTTNVVALYYPLVKYYVLLLTMKWQDPTPEMTPEYRRRVRHTIVSLTVCSHYHHGCRPSLLTTSCVRHNFLCVDARALHGTPRLGGGRRRQRPSRQILPWPSRCGGEEIRLIVRDKELFVNREQVRASFCKTGEVWFVCVRSRSDGYWWKMAGTTSSPTQDLFDS